MVVFLPVLALVTLDVPLGPDAEDAARELVVPYEHAEAIDGSPYALWDIKVQPTSIRYVVRRPDGGPTTRVTLDLGDMSVAVDLSLIHI